MARKPLARANPTTTTVMCRRGGRGLTLTLASAATPSGTALSLSLPPLGTPLSSYVDCAASGTVPRSDEWLRRLPGTHQGSHCLLHATLTLPWPEQEQSHPKCRVWRAVVCGSIVSIQRPSVRCAPTYSYALYSALRLICAGEEVEKRSLRTTWTSAANDSPDLARPMHPKHQSQCSA